LPPRSRPLGIGCPSRVCYPHAYRRYGLGDPTLPLALTSALWFSALRAGLSIFQRSATLLSSGFAFLQSITQSNLAAARGRSLRTKQLLPWALFPYSTLGVEGPLTTGFACPLRSALRVWLPSRRFTPFDPVPVLFHTGSARGIHPSELSPLGRFPSRFRDRRTHLPFHPPILPALQRPKAPAPSRLAGPRFLGFLPSESASQPGMGLACRLLAAPLGFSPSRAFSESLGWDFARPPLARFAGLAANHQTHWRPRVSIGSRLTPSPSRVATAVDKAALLGFCTGTILDIRAGPPPGYVFTSRRAAHYCRLTGVLWEDALALPELPGPAKVPLLAPLLWLAFQCHFQDIFQFTLATSSP
jgi:hypothetical protein